MALEFVWLRFEGRVTEGGQLPRFFGPTLRGALGLSLRKLVCVTHLPECSPCLLRFQCPYPRFFEPFAPPDHPLALRLRQMPRPFALQVPPPSDAPVEFSVGAPFSFRLVVWQHAETLLPYLVLAFRQALERGIGKGVKVGLKRVIAETPKGEAREVYQAEEGIVQMKLPTCSVAEILAGGEKSPVSRLTVHFLTPVRIDLSGKLQNPVGFEGLIKAANERGRALFWAYEGVEPPWDGKGLVMAAKEVRMVAGEQRWVEMARFSRRQGERMKMGGVMGWAVYEGKDLAAFLLLLRMMEVVHVGKLATMGLGQIAVEASDDGGHFRNCS